MAAESMEVFYANITHEFEQSITCMNE